MNHAPADQPSAAANRALYDYSAWAVIVISVVGQTIRYLQNRGLRFDECRVALNIIQRDFLGLTRPLDHDQAAPIAFLWIERALVLMFGNHEYSLRLFPLLAGLATPVIFWWFARRTGTAKAAAIGTCVMAVNYHILQYSGELKQYSVDMAVSTILIAVAASLICGKVNSLRLILLAMAGAVSIWFSHPALFVFAGAWCAVAGRVLMPGRLCKKRGSDPLPHGDNTNTSLNEKGSDPVFVQSRPGQTLECRSGLGLPVALGSLGVGTVIFLGSFYVNYQIAIVPLISLGWTTSWWNEYFAPFPPVQFKDFVWYVDAFERLLISIRSSVYVGLLLAIPFLIGIGSFTRKNPWLGVLLLLPAILALVASMMGRFGFADRQILFLQPPVIFLIAKGLEIMLQPVSVRWPRLHDLVWKAVTAVCIIVPGCVLFLGGPWHWNRMETRPALEIVSSRIKTGDVIYVTRSAYYPFEYYAPFYRSQDGVALADWPDLFLAVGHEETDPAGYEAELDEILGKHPSTRRVWVITAQFIWIDFADVRPAIQKAIAGHGRLDRFDTDGVTIFELTGLTDRQSVESQSDK